MTKEDKKHCENIVAALFEKRDLKYRDFQAVLIPNLNIDSFIGVRTPVLRNMAKNMIKDEVFLNVLPHCYFDENQLHGFIISYMKDFYRCIDELEKFLPYIDNWATCDQTSPKIFKNNKDRLLIYVKKWLMSEDTYTIRFAIKMLMEHFLDDDFMPEYLEWVSAVKSSEYYVNMMIAWYFATALAKQYDLAVGYIENKKMTPWVHNKIIQKANESYRIMPETKEYLRGFKIK